MLLFDLRFDSEPALLDAFGRVNDRGSVTSCTLQKDALQLRFIAPQGEAQELAQRIYLDGGLRWCTSHLLQEVAEQGRGLDPDPDWAPDWGDLEPDPD